MSSDEIILDAALLDEVSAFLNASDPYLPHSPRTSSALNANLSAELEMFETSSPISPNSPTTDRFSLNAKVSSSSTTTGNDAALKRKTRREKEALRKQRYQRRRKHERDTLRRMEKVLIARLLLVKQTQKDRTCTPDDQLADMSSSLRGLARRERQERLRAEEEHKRLVEADTTQTSYLTTLQDLLPNPTKLFNVEAAANAVSTCGGTKQVTDTPCDFDLIVL